MAIQIVMPKLGMVMSEGTIARWTKEAGEKVSQGDVIAEIETEKLNYDLEATGGGIFHPIVDEGAVVPVDGVAGYILAEGEAVPDPVAPAPVAAATPASAGRAQAAPRRPKGAPVRSTPGARNVAAKLGVDIAEVTSTGPGGRVVEADVRAHAEQNAAGDKPDLPLGVPEPSRVVDLVGMRKGIARHMKKSLDTTAQLTFMLEADVTDVQRRRREVSEEKSVVLTMAHVLIKACVETIKRSPEHNTIMSGDKIYYFDEVNMGVAVALPDGLIVPVLRAADKMSVFDISRATHNLVTRAKEGKLSPDDVTGGTFTISVLGMVDGFTPILSAGQSAIVGVGRSVEKPVVRKGEVVVREMMALNLTVDHQVIDGVVAAVFLRRLQQAIERPEALFR
jgi:pyruvate dehydrogenase E2 component (dihydrolipoamide acetyltransferase)